MNNKKCFGVLSSAALGILIAAALTTTSHAAVKSYVVNNGGKIISFDANALIQDYSNKLIGQASPMYDEYLKDASNIYAFQDDKKGLVSANAVQEAYENALANGKDDFSVDNFTENASDTNIIKDVTVGYEWKNGKILPVNKSMPAATVERVGTEIVGETSVVVSLPQGVDAAQYDVTIDGTKLTYNSSTGKFTGTLTGTYTIAELQTQTTVSNKSDNENVELTGVYAVPNSNGRKITLIFNKEMDSNTLGKTSNYKYYNADGDNEILPSNSNIEISADNKSITIELPGSYTYVDSNGNIGNPAINLKDNQVVKVYADGVKDRDGNDLEAGNTGGAIQAPSTKVITTVKENSIRLYYDGDDLKADIAFTNPIDADSIDNSKLDFYLAGVKADSVSVNGAKLTLTFNSNDDDVTANTKINTIKAAGLNAKLTMGSAAGTVSNVVKDVMGVYVGIGSDAAPYYYDAAPRTIVLKDSNGCSTNWTANVNGTTATVTAVFDTPIDANNVKPSDFNFAVNGASLEPDTARAAGNTIVFTFNTIDKVGNGTVADYFKTGSIIKVTPDRDASTISTLIDRK